MNTKGRTWAEINLENIKFNYNSIKTQLAPNVNLLGVVKADAYGHGSIQVSHALEDVGCSYFAVATADEAVLLRNFGNKQQILVLGYSPVSAATELIERNIIQSISDYDTAKQMSDIAVSLNKKLHVHIKIDSGMGRLGFISRNGYSDIEDIEKVCSLPGLCIDGIFTHFAVSEVYDSEYTEQQFASFMKITNEIEHRCGFKFALRHCANSGAVCGHPETQLDMVRPGIMIYGVYPGNDHNIPLRPAMSFKTRIVHIKEAENGWTVSYGRKFTANGKRKIAVVPVGYADGLHRCLSGKIDMLYKGKRVPQIGSICMDMCMLDITGIDDASIGDIVTVFGSDGDEYISIDELAEKANTISYELLCSVSKRVPRIYI